ncbi:2-oxoglutarate dehydrogenase, E2 component, dihydrolipoamide succinyltransferase domain protein [Mycobacterium xenopi 3993]|nr:2-oxoglutarate dehydrogenase, E2 component, dihydrolipoamide succinyltransferase domain protein [Mycobacterium xenopi 3993]
MCRPPRRDFGVDLVGGHLHQRLVDLHRIADLLSQRVTVPSVTDSPSSASTPAW